MRPLWAIVLLLTGLMIQALVMPIHAIPVEVVPFDVSTPAALSNETTSSAQDDDVIIGPPVKRHVGSIAREGSLSRFSGKRRPPQEDDEDWPMDVYTDVEDELGTAVKRFLGSVVRQGGVPTGKRMLEEQPGEEVEFDSDDYLDTDKRYIGALVRNGDMKAFLGRNGRRFSSSYGVDNSQYDDDPVWQNKRHLGSVVRTGSFGKRYLGSLARGNTLPGRVKRSLEEEEDAFEAPEKKHIGSIARAGWLPYVRSQRQPFLGFVATEKVPDDSYKRNIKEPVPRSASAIAARLRLLRWLQKNTESAEKADRLTEKKNYASLARGDNLGIRCRTSRSARDGVPFVERRLNGRQMYRPALGMRAPHAFVSQVGSDDDTWMRFRRNVASLARQGLLHQPIARRCADGTISTDCAEDFTEDKRYLGSLARTQQLPRFAEKRAWSDLDEEMDDDSSAVDEMTLPYSEINF